MLKNIGDIIKAIKIIEDNPNTHGFSESDYNRILEFQKKSMELNEGIAKNRKKIEKHFSGIIADFKFSLAAFDKKIEDTRFVASHDWFISYNLFLQTPIVELAKIINEKNINTFQAFILKTFPSMRSRIFEKINNNVPHRKAIVSEIETLYKNANYYSVIVLCYTQVDGICNENLGYGFFDKDYNDNDYLRINTLEANDSLASKIAMQLKEKRNEITRFVNPEIKARTFDINSFNRHLVIHGHSTNYGNQLNAIRSILLLDFICALIEEKVIVKKE